MTQNNRETCMMYRLPPELRNHIFHLTLGGDETVELNTPWPGVTRACKTLRADTLPIFLGNHNFLAHMKDLDTEPLISWLTLVTGLAPKYAAFIKSLTLSCEGNVLGTSRTTTGLRQGLHRYSPNFDMWTYLITRIKLAGLMSSQVLWSELRSILEASNRITSVEPLEVRLVQLYLLNAFVLSPLLQEKGLWYAEHAPVNVVEELRRDWSRLGVYAGSGDLVERRAKEKTDGDPEMWFERWMEKEKTEAIAFG